MRRLDASLGEEHQVTGKEIQCLSEGLIEKQLFARARMPHRDFSANLFKKRNLLAKKAKIKKLSFESIIKIRGVVSNFIHPIDELRFKRRARIEKVFSELRKFGSGI